MGWQFRRYYANGAGVAEGVSRPDASLSYIYARAGVAARLPSGLDLAVSGELGRQRLRTDAFREELSNANPFEADIAPATDRLLVGKLGAGIGQELGRGFVIGFRGALSHVLDHQGMVLVTVPGVGRLSAADGEGTSWFEYGAALSHRIAPNASVGIFVDGVTGNRERVGVENHFGLRASMHF